jgi:hypothetical protein
MAPVKVEEPEESALHEVLEEQNEHEQAEEVEEPMVSGPVPGSSSSDDTSPAVEHRRHAPVQVKIMKIDEAELQSIIVSWLKLDCTEIHTRCHDPRNHRITTPPGRKRKITQRVHQSRKDASAATQAVFCNG